MGWQWPEETSKRWRAPEIDPTARRRPTREKKKRGKGEKKQRKQTQTLHVCRGAYG